MYPLERQAFLRAHALVALTEGAGPAARHPKWSSSSTPPPPTRRAPTVDWGLPVELPAEVLRRLFATADLHPVVVHGGVVLHAPGRLDLGRTTRLANRAQRRALRALYPTCAIPGCDTRYDLCKLHHITWWEHGGTTDLAQPAPLCVRHHHDVHDNGWHLTLDQRPPAHHHLPRRHHPHHRDRHDAAPTGHRPHPRTPQRPKRPAATTRFTLLRC